MDFLLSFTTWGFKIVGIIFLLYLIARVMSLAYFRSKRNYEKGGRPWRR